MASSDLSGPPLRSTRTPTLPGLSEIMEEEFMVSSLLNFLYFQSHCHILTLVLLNCISRLSFSMLLFSWSKTLRPFTSTSWKLVQVGWGLALRVFSFIPVQNRPFLKGVSVLLQFSLYLSSTVTLNKVPTALFCSKLYNLYFFLSHMLISLQICLRVISNNCATDYLYVLWKFPLPKKLRL